MLWSKSARARRSEIVKYKRRRFEREILGARVEFSNGVWHISIRTRAKKSIDRANCFAERKLGGYFPARKLFFPAVNFWLCLRGHCVMPEKHFFFSIWEVIRREALGVRLKHGISRLKSRSGAEPFCVAPWRAFLVI
jgi:hypothetical protein